MILKGSDDTFLKRLSFSQWLDKSSSFNQLQRKQTIWLWFLCCFVCVICCIFYIAIVIILQMFFTSWQDLGTGGHEQCTFFFKLILVLTVWYIDACSREQALEPIIATPPSNTHLCYLNFFQLHPFQYLPPWPSCHPPTVEQQHVNLLTSTYLRNWGKLKYPLVIKQLWKCHKANINSR